MRIIRFFKNNKTPSLLETFLIGIFAFVFAVWLLELLPQFGQDGTRLVLTCFALAAWFLFTETLKMSPIFLNKKVKRLLLFADTLVFGTLIIYLIHLFHDNLAIDKRVEFLLFLPAISLPLYYDYLPGLFSILLIYFAYFVTSYFDGITLSGGQIPLQLLSYLLVYILLSLTMRKKAEANTRLERALKQVEALDRAKDTFIATAAHELKGPVTILSGYLSMLKNDELDSKERKGAIDSAFEGAENLSLLTKRLFDINRIQLHKLELNLDTLMANELCKKLIKDYQSTNNNPEIEFFYEEKGEIPPIFADRELLKEVLINLLNNAIKFTAKGKITLSIENKKESLLFTVKDTGVGISENEAQKIFKKFYQTSKGQSTHLGLGLGLHLCQEIVKEHKGKIWVESKIGKGSNFYFTIPKKAILVR